MPSVGMAFAQKIGLRIAPEAYEYRYFLADVLEITVRYNDFYGSKPYPYQPPSRVGVP